MSANLLETVKSYFTNDYVNQASSQLGESSSGISKALSGIIPASLAGILNKATSSSDGANNIFNMAKSAMGELPSTSSFGNTAPSQGVAGSNFLSGLFGANHSGISSMISKFAGIKDSSASSLMSMGIPAILGLLGKHAVQNNMTPGSLSSYLSTQKENIVSALPSGLSSLAGMFGLGSVGAAASDLKNNVVNRSEDVVHKTGGNKWLLPLIIILAALALILYFSKGCNKPADTSAAIMDTVRAASKDTAAVAPMPAAHESIKVKLPNGKELDAYKGGIEDQLVTFLEGNWKSMSDDELKAKWFDFDNLNFNTGQATLMPGAEKQLENISEILKAFPAAKIKIGGYTDVTGDAASNKKLSQDRANTAKDGLDKLGVGKQVTDAEGYGSAFAKYPATASEEERVTDRRVSVSVRK